MMFPQEVSDDELIDDLLRVADELDTDHVSINQYNDVGEYSPSTFRRAFGTWNEAHEIAGLETRPPGAKLEVPAELIYRLYFEELMDPPEIADKLGIGPGKVRDVMRENDIPRGVPKNIRYLISRGPASGPELPTSQLENLDQVQVRIGSGRTRKVYFLKDFHAIDEIVDAVMEITDGETTRSDVFSIPDKYDDRAIREAFR